jgi:hypothetical protein
MVQRLFRVTLLATVAVAALSVLAECQAAEGYRAHTAPFQNQFVQPGPSGVSASLYPSPVPTPPFVGHTWVTYEPLAPHEFLYRHHRTYTRENPGAGTTRTRVSWR